MVSSQPERFPVAKQPRILVLDNSSQKAVQLVQSGQPGWEVISVRDPAQAAALLHAERFDGFFTSGPDGSSSKHPLTLLQAELTLEALAAGVAILTPDLVVSRANVAFERWCGGPVLGKSFFTALGLPKLPEQQGVSLELARSGRAETLRLQGTDGRHLEFEITPLLDLAGRVTQLVALGRDVTAEVQKQQMLDALHQAGRELAELPAEQLADMSVAERIEVLKRNIRRYTHDLLHHDVIEIRLLDAHTGRLEPLLQDGMTEEAASRVLHAATEGNGVTGWVAATGKSHLCADTTCDPQYLEGARGARSSLTVPLLYHDKVVGTFNVESPEASRYSADDLKYAELFSKEIAAALHTLELLTAQKQSSTSESVEAISRAVALPVDEILAAATALLDRYLGLGPEVGSKLRKILETARAVKQCILKIGDDLAPAGAAVRSEVSAHLQVRGMRILVADNDDRIRRSAHALLGRYGCVVETARDGQEAIMMAKLSEYDAILADIRLPDLSGYEVFLECRKAQPRARVILMSGYGYDPGHTLVKARQDGLRHVLFKPFRIDQLLDALESPLSDAVKAERNL